MNIVFVSTFEQQCGVATYTAHLARALAQLGHQVFVYAEHTAISAVAPPTLHDADGVRYVRQWRRGAPYESPHGLGQTARSITTAAMKPDIVHVQHEFGIFPRTDDLCRFQCELGLAGIKVAYTFHTVDLDHILGLKNLAHQARVLVHSVDAQALLWECEDVDVVPHGTLIPSMVVDALPRALLVLGFVSASKNTLEIVEAYWRARRALPAYPYPLRILGLCRDSGYEAKLRAALAQYQLDPEATFINAYLEGKDVHRQLCAAEAVILGGKDGSPYSASGQLHDALSYNVPIIAKRVPIYQHPGATILYYDDAESLAQWMLALTNASVKRELHQRNALLAQAQEWSKVGAMTVKAYA